MARPEKVKPEFVAMARKACQLGATDADLAEMFDVCVRTLNNWKITHPDFTEALQVGKSEADARVERSLYERAMGYSHPDVHIAVHQGEVIVTPITKRYPPDTTAAIFWLKNRQPAQWREKQEVQHGTSDRLTEVLAQINRRGSAAPIATQGED